MQWKSDPVLVIALVLLGLSAPGVSSGQAIPINPLRDVKRIQILPTLVKTPNKVKNPDATMIVENALRRAILANEIQAADAAPVRARIVLEEFTGGSSATRFLVGFGAGRSTVDCRIQLLDGTGKEIAGERVRVRGDLNWSPYEGNSTQTKQAVNKFERALIDEIDKWIGPRVQKVH